MEELRERIRAVFVAKKSSANKIAAGDAAIQNKFSRQLRGAAVTADLCQLVLNAFPDVSAEWLMRGEGDMIKHDHTEKVININRQGGNGDGQTNTYDYKILAAADVDIVNRLMEQNEMYVRRNNELTDKLERLMTILIEKHEKL